jgi:TP901 family phage tail tape measure protein
MAVQINVAANQAALTASIQAGVQAYNQRFAQNNQLNLTVNQRAFSQPLGRMTGDVKDFEAALAASNARVIAFGASTAVLGGVINSFKELANVTISVEKNLADINRVFGLTTSQLQKFSTDLFSVSKQTASSFDDASKAALEFSRQGLKAEETLQRTKDALTLTRLAGIGTANAVDALTSTVNGFAATGVTTTQILNKLVAVEQDYAVGAGDLAEALSRTGQAAQEAGVSLDQLNALVTAAQQSTARGGAVIGNALKTIFTRLQRTETLDQLEAFNIAVRDVEGNILPAVSILQNFAGAYKTLGDAQRAQLSEQVAGVYQVNILKAIVGDLNKSQGVYAGALQRGASATNEAEIATAKLNQTLDALLKQTATSTQQLANNIGKVTFEPLAKYGTEQLKSFVESINETLEGEGVGSTFANGLLKGIRNVIAGPGAIAAFFTLFKLIQNSFTYLSQALPQIAGITTETQNRKNIEQSILQIMQQQGPASQALAGMMGNQAAQAQLLLQIARQQTAEYQMQSTLAKQLAAQLATQGVRVKGSGGLQVTRAGGYIPTATRMAEVVGAQAGGYAPGRVVSSPVGGVMNTAEDVKYIPGFAQPFINPPAGSKAGRAHRQNSISRTGVDPYMNSGFIPNFTLPDIYGKEYGLPLLAGRVFESLLRGDNYISLTENRVSADIDKGPFAPPIKEAKLSGKAAYRDKNLGIGKPKGSELALPLTAIKDYDEKLKKRGININRVGYTHPELFTKAKEIVNREKDNKNTNISHIKLFDGFIPNFAPPTSAIRVPWFKKFGNPSFDAIQPTLGVSRASDVDTFRSSQFRSKAFDKAAIDGDPNLFAPLYEDFAFKAMQLISRSDIKDDLMRGYVLQPGTDQKQSALDAVYRKNGVGVEYKGYPKKNLTGTIGGELKRKYETLSKTNPEEAAKLQELIIAFNEVGHENQLPSDFGKNFTQLAGTSYSQMVKNSPDLVKGLSAETNMLLGRYVKNPAFLAMSAAKGFIPNFAYKQAVMGLEEGMSGNKAIFDTKPFPHIRNSSQPTFSSAIADHGGLGNALSDSMRGQKAAGLMSKGFVPNFAPRPYRYSGRGSVVDPSSGISQYSAGLGFSLADQERRVKDEFNKIINSLRTGAMNAQQATTAFNTLNTQAGLSARAQTSLTRILNREVATAGSGGTGGAAGNSRLQRFSERLSKASTAISIAGPVLAGFAEQAVFGNKKRTEMTSTERSLQSGLSTGLSSVSTGAGIGGAVGGIPGAVVGGLIGGLIGLTSAVQASSLSIEELNQLTDEQKTKTQENLSAGQKYIQAQEEYAKLLASGASSTQLENASRNLTNSFNEIKDVKLAEELSKTKGGVEALNSVLGNFEQEQKKLTSGLEFASLIKSGKIESGLQKTAAGKALSSLGLNQEQLQQLQNYKKRTEKTRIPSIGGGVMPEIDVVSQASVDEAKNIAKQIAQKQLGGKGTAAEIESIQESLTKALLEGTLPDIISTIDNSDAATKQAVKQAKALASLYSTRNKLEAQIIKDISSGNQLIKQSEFSQKLLDALNDFQVSMMEGVANPLDIAAKKAQSQISKFTRDTEDEQRKANIDFVKQNYKTLLESSQNPTYIEQSIKPAIAEMLKGNFAPFENLLSGSQSVGAFAQSSALGEPSVLQPKESQQLKEAYQIYKATEAERKLNNGDQKKLIDQDILLQNLKSTTLLLQSNIIKDEISLTAQRERLEIQRKNTLDLEIDAIERRQSDEANYFGMSVAGKAQSKGDFRNQILQKKLIDTEISRSKSAQTDYSEVIKMQNENALKQADILQGEGKVIQADSVRANARGNKGIEIKDLTSLNQAITSLESTKFNDPKQEEQRVKTLEKLKTVQTEINDGKIKETQLNDRLNKQELVMAERSTSFKYGVVKGFDNLRTESELMIGRLGEDLPKMFADGLVNGIKAAIRESDNLGGALMGIASTFLDTISTILMQSAVYGILGNIGVPNLPVAAKQRGGVIRAQSGMYISGVGSGDKYPALLENGEYVLNRNAVMAMGGPASLDKLNFSAAPRFAAGGTFSSSFDDIASMESNMTSYGLEESKLYNELRDQKRAEIEAARQKKRAQKQQMAGLIGSLAAGAVSLGLSAGISKLNQPAKLPKGGYAATTAGKLEAAASLNGSPEMITLDTKQTGGLIGSRLSDTIPAYATGGLINSPIVKRYAIGGISSAGFGTAAGNNSTVNNNTSASNSFNFNTTVQRDGKIQVGANSTSYAQQDVELSQSLNGKVYDVVLETIRKEKRFGGSLAGIRN